MTEKQSCLQWRKGAYNRVARDCVATISELKTATSEWRRTFRDGSDAEREGEHAV